MVKDLDYNAKTINRLNNILKEALKRHKKIVKEIKELEEVMKMIEEIIKEEDY